MAPVLHHRGPAGQQWLENEKAPSVTGGAQKIPVRGIQRTRKPFGSPAQGGLNSYGAHLGRMIETEHDDHPKILRAVRNRRASKRPARNRAAYFRQSNFMAHGINSPVPTVVLDSNRPDLDLAAIELEDDAVVVVGLRVDYFAQIESHSGQSSPCHVVILDDRLDLHPDGASALGECGQKRVSRDTQNNVDFKTLEKIHEEIQKRQE